MKIISWNVNGLMACLEKNGFEPIAALRPDIVCCQEVKTRQRPKVLPGYYHFWETGQREGYAGVLTLAQKEPLRVLPGLGNASLDQEGRIITLEYETFFLINAYYPNSQDSPFRRDYRERWDKALFDFVQNLSASKTVLICGDFNVTRAAIDIFPENTRLMEKEKGYISDERSSLETLLDSGYIDAFRYLYPDKPGAYTWWSQRFDKRSKNDGWRLDYFVVPKLLSKRITEVIHHTDIFGSDHCPIELRLHLPYCHGESFDKGQLAQRRPRIDFPDSYLAEIWDSTDWVVVENNLAEMQKRLAIAASKRDTQLIAAIQKQIVRTTENKMLAVRKVCSGNSGPGVDGVKWKESDEKMRAALMLNSKGYHAEPMRNIIVHSKATGRDRTYGLPTYFDRAMQVLYGFSLAPVLESWGEKKSFAFRRGRSALDANAYILHALQARDAPEFVVIADVMAYYANIQHEWLMGETPMDKKVLAEFLRAGFVFAGELFPKEEVGISLGGNISPLLGNFVLDGLQKYIYEHLYGMTQGIDYLNGNLVRFADDILVTVRSETVGYKVLDIIRRFLSVRGLELSEEKCKVCSVYSGFDFISRHYQKQDGWMHVVPSTSAIERMKSGLGELILTHKRSQKNLIDSINRKLTGWATYHRYTDARAAFREIDKTVQDLLWQSAKSKHPQMAEPKLRSRYWYSDSSGKSIYTLPNDRSVRVKLLADVPTVTCYEKILLNKNPYIDLDYFQKREEKKQIISAAGKYGEIWKRQRGNCYHCGRPILPDQDRTVVQIDIDKPVRVSNLAYVHTLCKTNELNIQEVLGDISVYSNQELLESTPEIMINTTVPVKKEKGPITARWPHIKLKEWFAGQTKASITLTFRQIEEIDQRLLPESTKKYRANWYTRPDQNAMAEAWITEGYKIQRLDMEKQKVTFHRCQEGIAHVKLPGWITGSKVPEEVKSEVEHFLAYIASKYGLR